MRSLPLALIFIGAVFSFAGTNAPSMMVEIRSGKFIPFTGGPKRSPDKANSATVVERFSIDKTLISNADFLTFVKAHSEWRKSEIKPIFADSHYLEYWLGNLSVSNSDLKRPVVFVSWFAASAYCQSLGKDLPSTMQWEFVLADKGRDQEKLQAKILSWYSRPNSRALPGVNLGSKNGFGVSNLGFVVWEWTSDFNSFLVSSDSREGGGKDSNLFCGNGSQMGDPSNYAAFMRYSFRSSLKANYTTANLGFRCAKEIREVK